MQSPAGTFHARGPLCNLFQHTVEQQPRTILEIARQRHPANHRHASTIANSHRFGMQDHGKRYAQPTAAPLDIDQINKKAALRPLFSSAKTTCCVNR